MAPGEGNAHSKYKQQVIGVGMDNTQVSDIFRHSSLAR
jgi:hypothetical protein